MRVVSDEEMFVEMNEIFKHLSLDLYNKIPQSIRDFVDNYKSDKYDFKYDTSKKLSEQDISKSARDFIGLLHYKYWCATKEERESLKKILNENEQKNIEKYSYENIFKDNIDEHIDLNESEEIHKELIIKKESFFEKIIRKIKELFHR